MAKYVYPAIFTEEEDGFSIHFPDIQGCYTQGDDLPDGLEMAEDALALMLYDRECSNQEIPEPTPLEDIAVEKGQFATLVKCDTMIYRKAHNNRAVKKTLTIPAWLNEEAEAQGINFSGVLQNALKQQLNID